MVRSNGKRNCRRARRGDTALLAGRRRVGLISFATFAVLLPTIGMARTPSAASVSKASTARVAAGEVQVPPGLPTHFAFGLAAAPDQTGIDGWMPASEEASKSDIRWDYAYQYLSGGVDTNGSGGDEGWETWNSDGEFPLYYAQGSAAATPNPYIPVFTYYEMRQSGLPCSSECPPEAEVDLNNLNDPTLMDSYFDNFTELMERLGPNTYNVGGQPITGFGKTGLPE